jgi:hypothetical protein
MYKLLLKAIWERCRYIDKQMRVYSRLHRASIVSKTLFIVPTDAHYYKIIEMLNQYKITILVPTCFGSRRNHHQGAVLCLTKATEWYFFVLVCIDVVNVMAAYQPVVQTWGS